MLERLTEITDRFEARGKTHRIIRINQKSITSIEDFERLEREYCGYLVEQGEGFYDPDYSDPNSDCCLDFSRVRDYPSLAIAKLVGINKVHKRKREDRPVSLSNLNLGLDIFFRFLKLDSALNIYKTNEKYREAAGLIPRESMRSSLPLK